MSLLESLLTTGRIVDLMIVFLVLEIALITTLRKTRGVGIAALPLIVNIGAGGSIMLALRAALTDAGSHWIAAFLLCALIFHIWDLVLRWQSAED
jgi:hypothetical protein